MQRSIKAAVIASSVLLGVVAAPAARAFTDADATTLFNKFNEAFYSGSGNAYYKSNKSGGDTGFWQQAEIMEMVCDRYNKAPSQGVKDMISALCSGFVGIRGSNWSYNGFNDDLCWASMVFSRAYQKTGNTQFRDIAKTNFDIMYARAWNTSFMGGGLWWLYPNNNSKNSCVEGPGSIAAYWIYQNTGDSSYLTKAQNILAWERGNLFNETTGAVWDSVNTSMIYSKVALTYNQGTFIRACDHLGQTGGATKACDYMKNTLGTVVGAHRIMPNYGLDNNNSGFNGIGIRYAAQYMINRGMQSQYLAWLQANAQGAWDQRRTSDLLSWQNWREPLLNGTGAGSWSCVSSVVALQVVPTN
jgi:predicted alpha-1,6-mannanase (GH76 family)